MNKTQINKLGRVIKVKLRNEEELSFDEIENLQEYRISFKEDLSEVFKLITNLSTTGRKDSIVSYRIKRIESILSKIRREPTMALGNMGDIAGCRIILYSKKELLNLVEVIKEKFEITSINDYLASPKEDGYNGFHIYVKSPLNDYKKIEIQLRLITTHKWASLVEIIDILYNLKLKEGERNDDLLEFLYLLSLDKKEISIDQKKRIIEIDNTFRIYSRLNEVFLKNHITIRHKWLKISENRDNNYFIFEVDKHKKSDLTSFEDYLLSEDAYFEKFRKTDESNFVLAYIEKPSFKRICIAYSSYLLIKHDYLEDYWNDFSNDIISSQGSKDIKIYEDYITRNIDDVKLQILKEVNEIETYLENSKNNQSSFSKIGVREWVEELKERLADLSQKKVDFSKKIDSRKQPSLWDRIFK